MQRNCLLWVCFCCVLPAVGVADDWEWTDRERAVVEEVDRILERLTPPGDGVDHETTWVPAMMELAELGTDIIPHIDALLQTSEDDHLKRKLFIVLRALDDERALPTLIRAWPQMPAAPRGSDYGLVYADAPEDVKEWLAIYCGGVVDSGGVRFDYGRQVNECGKSLRHLSGQSFGDSDLAHCWYLGDAARDNAIDQMFFEVASRWAEWWNENAPDLADDERYHWVTLDEPNERAVVALSDVSEADVSIDGMGEVTVAAWNSEMLPMPEQGLTRPWCFRDLDARRFSGGPEDVANWTDDDAIAWGAAHGFELTAIDQGPEATPRFVIRVLNGTVWPIENIKDAELKRLAITSDFFADSDEGVRDLQVENSRDYAYRTESGCCGVIEVSENVLRTYSGFNEQGHALNEAGEILQSRDDEDGPIDLWTGVRVEVRDLIVQPE